MKKSIVGRKKEVEKLRGYINSRRSEFIAVYGRRRVGKTYLIKELFEGEFTFRMTGRENVQQTEQLVNFSFAMTDYFGVDGVPENWAEAFRMLAKAIENMKEGAKIIFIDELPWLDTPKSKFVSALEYFWNNWAFYRTDIKLIVCGSATSWMLSKLINSRGGLHNRVTHKMLISPFSLCETEQYFKSEGFVYERSEIIDCYMAIGGIAYYLSLFDKSKSVAENVNALCFTHGGELVNEFDKLFKSIFKRADNHIAVIKALSSIGKGMTRGELIAKTKFLNNGNLSELLRELEMCEFIRSYTPFGKAKKEKMYQLIDQFSLFHLRFIRGNQNFEKDYWLKKIGTGEYNAWCGYAFETVCLHHIEQIVNGLGINGIINTPCSWTYRPTKVVLSDENADEDLKNGGQIDLLIDRGDKTITLCEMKYSDSEFEIDKECDRRVQERIRIFKKVTKTRKSIVVTYVTPQGLYDNMYARKIVRQITGNHLFVKT